MPYALKGLCVMHPSRCHNFFSKPTPDEEQHETSRRRRCGYCGWLPRCIFPSHPLLTPTKPMFPPTPRLPHLPSLPSAFPLSPLARSQVERAIPSPCTQALALPTTRYCRSLQTKRTITIQNLFPIPSHHMIFAFMKGSGQDRP